MGMQAGQFEIEFTCDREGFFEFFVPDPERRGRTARIRSVVVAATGSGIDTDRELAASKEQTELAQLMERAGVEQDAPLDEALEIAWQLLCGDLDMPGIDPGAQRAFGLEPTAGVDMQTLLVEYPQYGGVGQCFHGESPNQPAGCWEGQDPVRGSLEFSLVVDENGRSEPLSDPLDLGSIEKTHKRLFLPGGEPSIAAPPNTFACLSGRISEFVQDVSISRTGWNQTPFDDAPTHARLTLQTDPGTDSTGCDEG